MIVDTGLVGASFQAVVCLASMELKREQEHALEESLAQEVDL